MKSIIFNPYGIPAFTRKETNSCTLNSCQNWQAKCVRILELVNEKIYTKLQHVGNN